MKYSGNVIELSHVTRYHDYLMVFLPDLKGWCLHQQIPDTKGDEKEHLWKEHILII